MGRVISCYAMLCSALPSAVFPSCRLPHSTLALLTLDSGPSNTRPLQHTQTVEQYIHSSCRCVTVAVLGGLGRGPGAGWREAFFHPIKTPA
jgi:hypothetical protein